MNSEGNNLEQSGLVWRKTFSDRQYWSRLFEHKQKQPAVPYDVDEKEMSYLHKELNIQDICKLSHNFGEVTRKNPLIAKIYGISAVAILTYKMVRCEEVFIGIPLEGTRMDENGSHPMTVLKLNINTNMTVRDVLNQTKLALAETAGHKYVSVTDYYKEFLLSEEGNPIPFVTVFFSEEDTSALLDEYTEYKNEFYVRLISSKEKLDGYMGYDSIRYRQETVQRTGNMFAVILQQILEDADAVVKNIQLVSKKEIELLDFSLEAQFPQGTTLHQLFEKQADLVPEKIAVVAGNETLTYLELEKRANQIANYLREQYRILPDTLIGVLAEKDIDLIPLFLGILKAGGAYVPLNPDYPTKQLRDIINDSKMELLITKEMFLTDEICDDCSNLKWILKIEEDKVSHQKGISKKSVDVPSAAQEINLFEDMDSQRKASVSDESNIAYVIYTSGTTGKSNGVAIEHRNVISLMLDKRSSFCFGSDDIWPMVHSICFDVSVWEMYGALLYGGKLVLVTGKVARNFSAFLQLLKEEKATVLTQTPSAFYPLMQKEIGENDAQLALRYIIFCGEALNTAALQPFHKKYPETKLINMYGITETTVHNTYKCLSSEDIEKGISNIGTMIPTMKEYIMDEDGNILPHGMIGELCVAGYGVGRHYLNNPELTEKRFTKNPYCTTERIYKSGDLVRYLDNGDMEYCGRIDHQIKIRGYRVELSHIENVISGHPLVKQVAVITNKDKNGEKYICAYYVATGELDTEQLKDYISERVADYMVPTFILQMDEIPINANGKVNRKILPTLEEIMSQNEYVPPSSELEKKLEEIWCKVLGVTQIGVTQDFFKMGGHSLRAVMLEVEMENQNLPVNYADIYTYKTIREYALNLVAKGCTL